ncbi:MAG: PAS domain S-box protein [Paludibacter sp.]|nr:PAS domain S-box protein [Paludibacter sp.]
MEKGGISLATLLRVKAEKILKDKSPRDELLSTDADVLQLLHELEVYSVELEMQNDELLSTNLSSEDTRRRNIFSEEVKQRIIREFELNQIELDMQNEQLQLSTLVSKEVAERYSDLFNYSSTGYLILSNEGETLDLNYSAARLLGKERIKLKNSRFGFFVAENDRPVFNGFLSDLFNFKINISCEVSLIFDRLPTITVLLSGILIQNQEQCLISVLDITEREQTAKYRNLTRDVLQVLNEPGDIRESLHRTLTLLKNRTGFDAIGIRLQEGEDFPYLEQVGFTTDFILKENTLIELDRKGKVCRDKNGNVRLTCTCGLVISGNAERTDNSITPGGSWWTNDSSPIPDIPANKDTRYHPRNHCMHEGYHSIALIPIRSDKNIVGLIQFNDYRKGAFNQNKVEFLEGIASHIGAALMRKQAEETLRKNEELLRSITTNAPDIIIQLDRQGTILYMNRPFPGYTLEESIGKNFCESTLPDFHNMMNQSLELVFETSATQTYLTWGSDKQGEMHWYRSSISPVKEGERVKNAVLITRDITESIYAEDTLRESEEKRNAIIMTAMDGFSLTDRRGCFLEVNDAYCRMHGYSRQEMLTLRIQDVETVESENDTLAHIQKIIELGDDRFETSHRHKDGTVIYVEANVQYRKVNGGQFVSFVRDITERKKTELELHQSEERYKSLFQENHSVMLLIQPETGAIIDANPTACDYYGWTKSELCSKNISDINTLSGDEVVTEMQAAKEEKRNHFFFKHRLANDEIRDVEVYSGPIRFGDKTMLYSLVHDITDRRKAEEALIESEGRVRHKLESILFPEGSIADLELNDIIDAPSIQNLMDSLYELVPVPMAIIDTYGKVLVGTGWQDICTKFHRVHPESCLDCLESDQLLTQGIPDGEFRLYKCKNNMWDIATPIIIGGEHKGNLFMGQFFFDNEPIDRQQFRAQAQRYGYDLNDYMAALDRVPQLSVEKLDHAKSFFLNLSRSISQLSYSNIKLAKSITQQQIVEEALQKNKDNLRAILDATQESIFLFDKEGTVVDANVTAAMRLKLDLRDLIGKKFLSELPSGINESRTGYLEKVIISGKPVQFEDTREEYIFEHNFFPVYTDGKVDHVVSFSRDITESRKKEQIIRDSEERFKLALKNSPVSVTIQDKNLEYTWAYNQMTHSNEEIIGKNDVWLYSPDDLSIITKMKSRVLGSGTEEHIQTWLTSNGERQYLDLYYEPVKNPAGDITGIGTAAVNLTQQKLAETALYQYIQAQEILSNAATKLLGSMSYSEILAFSVDQIQQMVGNSIVLLSEIDLKQRKAFIRATSSSDNKIAKMESILGTRLIDLSFQVSDDSWQPIAQRTLTLVEGGLHELSFRQYPVDLCREIETEVDIKALYTMQLTVDDDLMGTIIFSADNTHELYNKSLIETFIKQLSLALKTKRTEETLRESRAILDAALESMTDSVVISDARGRFIKTNEAFASFYKYNSTEECIKAFAELTGVVDVFLEDGTPVPPDMWSIPRALRGEKMAYNELCLRRKDTGETWTGSYSFAPIRSKEGEIAGSVVVARDITEIKRAEETIRNNERRLSEIYASMSEGLAIHEMIFDDAGQAINYRITEVNPAYERITGHSRAEVLDMKATDLYLTEEAPYLEIYSRVEQTGLPASFESYFAPMGKYFAISVFSPGKGRFVTVFRDVTDQKLAQEALLISERRMDAVINGVTETILLLDVKGVVLAANQTAANRWGLRVDEMIGKNMFDFVTPEMIEVRTEQIQEMIQTGSPIRFEDEFNGRTFDLTFYPIKEPSGIIRQFVVFNQDTTEIKQAQEELLKNEERYSLIYNSSRDGIFSLDLEGKITSANRSFCSDVNQEQSQIIGHTLAEVGLPEYLYQEVENWIIQVKDSNNTVNAEIKIPIPDGSVRYYEVILNPLHEDKNTIVGFGISIRNITKRKEATQALYESEKRFRYLIKDMQAGVLLYGPDSELMMTNPKALQLLGIAEEKLLTNSGVQKSWNAIHEDGTPFQFSEYPIPLAFASGQSVHDVIIGISIPGSEEKTWLLMNAEIIYKSEGTIRNVVCSFIDISRVKRAENELKISEQRLKYHFENSPLAVVEWDKDFNITQWSIEAEHMFGWKKEEAIGKKLESLNLVYEEDIPFVYYTLEKLTSEKDDTIVSYNRNFTKSGTIIDCMWYNSILLDENGKMTSVMALIQDVTLRKQAENALKKLNEELESRVRERTDELSTLNEVLKQAQDKYRTVADFATNWEFWIDPLDHMIYCSPSCERITGYTSAEFEDNSQLVLDIIYPDDLPVYMEHKKKELHAHVCDHELQYRIRKKDGAIRWIGHFCRPVYDELGNFRGIRGSNKDITARKKMEELLTTSNQKYKLLSENINDGIFICKRGKFEYVNNAVYDIFGYQGLELEGMKLTKLVNTDYHEDLETFLYTNYPENKSCNLEVECLKKDMTPVFVEILLNYSAKEKMVYGVLHDITEKKELQKNMLKAIIQTEEKERAYFSKELHDGLGPLLSTIKLYLQWSERPNSIKSRDEIIEKAGEILEEALATVKEISNKLSPHLLTNYGLNSAIKSFVDKLNATASYNIVFESNTARRIQVETEAALYRAVIECINNTLKYAQANNIHIRLDDTGSQIQLHYQDDGAGFDLSGTLAKQKGLGLFNLQNRIHTIGGKVELFSEPGKGVSYLFTVNL